MMTCKKRSVIDAGFVDIRGKSIAYRHEGRWIDKSPDGERACIIMRSTYSKWPDSGISRFDLQESLVFDTTNEAVINSSVPLCRTEMKTKSYCVLAPL